MWSIKSWFTELAHQGSTSIKGAAAIQLSTKYASILIGVGSQLVLARLLTPHDYGTMAVMLVFTAFFSMLSDFGISGAIVQNRQLDDEDISSIYAWSLRLAMFLGVGFAMLSYCISIFYEDAIYLRLGCLLSLSVFFNALNMVPNALLMKRKLFMLMGLRQMSVTSVSGIVTITLAWFGAGVYALIVSSVLSALLTYAWNVKGSDLQLSWHARRKSINKIKSFSLNVFGFNFVNYFARNLDNLLIGKAFGVVPLGNYNRAYQLMVYPMMMFTHIVTPALLPFIASHQNDKNYIYEKYLATVKILSLLGIFISIFCFFCAREIVLILFGDQWEAAVPCFQYLSISIWSQMICATSGTMFQAIGRSDLMFQRGLITSGTTVSCIIAGVLLGSLEKVAFFVSIGYCSNFFSMIVFLVKRGLRFDVGDFCRQLIPDGIIALLLAGFLLILCELEYPGIISSFALKFTATLLLYIFLLVRTKQVRYFLMICPARWRTFFEKRFMV